LGDEKSEESFSSCSSCSRDEFKGGSFCKSLRTPLVVSPELLEEFPEKKEKNFGRSYEETYTVPWNFSLDYQSLDLIKEIQLYLFSLHSQKTKV